VQSSFSASGSKSITRVLKVSNSRELENRLDDHRLLITDLLGGPVKSQSAIGKYGADAIAQSASAQFAPSTISQSVTGQSRPFTLSWTHYILLLSIKHPDERSFYEIEATSQNWTIRVYFSPLPLGEGQ